MTICASGGYDNGFASCVVYPHIEKMDVII